MDLEMGSPSSMSECSSPIPQSDEESLRSSCMASRRRSGAAFDCGVASESRRLRVYRLVSVTEEDREGGGVLGRHRLRSVSTSTIGA